MTESHDLTDVDHLTVGAVGQVGHRVFLLQARAGLERFTVKLEKQQVAALATYFARVLDDLPAPGHLPEDLDLEEPHEPAWVIGAIAITYDADLDRIVLVLEEAYISEESEKDDPDPAVIAAERENISTARLYVTREQAAALAIHGTQLVASGRPPCPLCSMPLDPSGHACPKTNGFRAPTP